MRRQLGNATFKGTGEDDAIFADLAPLRTAASCLGCEEQQLTKALCTQNIKAGLDWIAKPNTTTYSQNVKDALAKVSSSAPGPRTASWPAAKLARPQTCALPPSPLAPAATGSLLAPL